jgi:hypothetical protein
MMRKSLDVVHGQLFIDTIYSISTGGGCLSMNALVIGIASDSHEVAGEQASKSAERRRRSVNNGKEM